jgi:hypothetical protein
MSNILSIIQSIMLIVVSLVLITTSYRNYKIREQLLDKLLVYQKQIVLQKIENDILYKQNLAINNERGENED